jgi:hypothetical protein
MNRDEPVSGARLLFRDASVALLVLDEAWPRMLVRLFGISRDDSPLVTAILIGLAAGALHDKAAAIRKAPSPSASDTVIGAAVLDEAAHCVAGEWSREAPFFLPLVAFAVIWKYHPLARVSIRAVRASIRGAITSVRRVRAYGSVPKQPRSIVDAPASQ